MTMTLEASDLGLLVDCGLISEQESKYCESLAFQRSQLEACISAAMSPLQVKLARNSNPYFDEMVRTCELVALETELWTRAVDGIDEPITYKGEICATWRRKSDALLRLALQSRDIRYSDLTRVEHSGTVKTEHVHKVEGADHWTQIDADASAALADIDRLLPAPNEKPVATPTPAAPTAEVRDAKVDELPAVRDAEFEPIQVTHA